MAHGARVYRLCLRLLGNQADAEDATQEVFLKLPERIGSFSGRARFSTWLYRLTVNHCLHLLERERLRRVEALPEADHRHPRDEGGTPLEHASRAEAQATIQGWLQRLSSAHRAVIVLREIEGLSYQAIAEVLDIPEGTVMSRLARAREGLARLARSSPEPGARPGPRIPLKEVAS